MRPLGTFVKTRIQPQYILMSNQLKKVIQYNPLGALLLMNWY